MELLLQLLWRCGTNGNGCVYNRVRTLTVAVAVILIGAQADINGRRRWLWMWLRLRGGCLHGTLLLLLVLLLAQCMWWRVTAEGLRRGSRVDALAMLVHLLAVGGIGSGGCGSAGMIAGEEQVRRQLEGRLWCGHHAEEGQRSGGGSSISRMTSAEGFGEMITRIAKQLRHVWMTRRLL